MSRGKETKRDLSRMKLSFLFPAWMAVLASLSFKGLASAQTGRPVVVEYTAPTPECASSEAFQALLETEVARSPNPGRPWRFAVHIRREADTYEGMLMTETGVRRVTSTRCDDVTGALAIIVAVADGPRAPAPFSVVSPRAADRAPDRDDQPPQLEWRLGARFIASNHSVDGGLMMGGMGSGSIELPWGFRKMMFEVGVGTSSSLGAGYPVSAPPPLITYYLLDTQACLLDLAIEDTWLSVLGCIRVAGATFKTFDDSKGGALWGGANLRLRVQTPMSLFLEGNLGGVYGTVSGGENNNPAWFDAGASLGVRL